MPHHASLIAPNRKRYIPTSPTGRCLYFTIQHKKKTSLYPWQPRQLEIVVAQPMRRLHTLDYQLPPMDSLVITSASQFPAFPYKGKSPFLILWTCLLSTMVHISQISIPLLFPNKLTFASKITGYYIIRVDRLCIRVHLFLGNTYWNI